MTDYGFDISDAEITVLNAARDVLEGVAGRTRFGRIPNPSNGWAVHVSGRTSEAAIGADDAIFGLLNLIQSCGVREMTYRQIHNHDEPDVTAEDDPDGDKSDVELYGAGVR